MNSKTPVLAAVLMVFPGPAAFCGEFGGFSDFSPLREAIEAGKENMRARRTVNAEIKPAEVKDDLKKYVLRHLNDSIRYCDNNMDDCNGENGGLRAFAKGIGGGRCNNRGFNCVVEVLELCKRELERDEITPMYYMACAAFLGKLGERDCAEGRDSCVARLQGSLYFSLRAAAGCHKSYENDKENQAAADRLIDSFARMVNKNVKGVYVGKAERSRTLTDHLIWYAGNEAGGAVSGKVLEFAFERLAWQGAQTVASASAAPLFAFSAAMLFHEIAASAMNDQVCLKWSHSYNGSYTNVSMSQARMAAGIK